MSKSEKLCEAHGIDCAARTRREIESDAALIRMVLEDALRGTSPAPHPSGSFEAIKRLEAAALETLDLRNRLDEWSDRFDHLTLDNEVTKGYRQHAEQQLAEMREAWNSTAPLTANDLHRINEARARVMKTIRTPPCILCRGAGEIQLGICTPIKIERGERCGGTGKEPSP